MAIRRHMVVGIYGTSLVQGRLNTNWPQRYEVLCKALASCLGPFEVFNQGKGGQNSDWGVANAYLVANSRPTHAVIDAFDINDGALIGGVPEVTRANHITNVTNIVAALRAANPAIIIALMTMNPVSVLGQTIRPDLAARYNDTVALAATLVVDLIDNYNGTVTVPGGWTKPLDAHFTNGAAPFAIAPTAGYADLTDGTTWNPADAGAGIALSADDLTANNTFGGVAAVRATNALAAKVHFEATMNVLNGAYPVLGVASAAMALNTYPGAEAHGLGYNVAIDQVVYGGASQGAALGFAVAAGDVLAVEVDVPNNLVYYMWKGLRSIGHDMSGIGAAVFPTVGLFNPANITAKFTTDGDGLHPLQGLVDQYLLPNVVAWTATKQAAFWP